MTVTADIARKNYTGNGVLVTYPFTWEIYAKTDLKVYVSEVLQVVDVDYTIPGDSIEATDGGNVVFDADSIPAADAPVSIILDLPLTQLVDYIEGAKFPAETHERAIDRIVKIVQSFSEFYNRVPKLPIYSLLDLDMPTPSPNDYIGWNAAGDNLANITDPVTLTDAEIYEVDALVSYGSGTSYTKATIDDALTSIGVINPTTLLLRPGTWVMDDDADYSAYENVIFKIPQGSLFKPGVGKSVTIYSPENIIASPRQQIVDMTNNSTNPLLFTVGGSVYPKWFGAVADVATPTDDSDPFIAAFASIETKASSVIINRGSQYYIAADFTIPTGCSLLCDDRALDTRAASDLEDYGGLIYLLSTASISMAEASAIKNIIILRYGIVLPANAAEVANFAGTAINILAGAHGCLIENMNIVGFNTAIYSVGWTEQPRITKVNFDCRGGIYIKNCSDTAEISFCHGWPSASIDLVGVDDVDLRRAGIAYRIDGPNTQARIISSFSYGYLYGIYLEDTNGIVIVDCGAEYTATQIANPEGIHTTGSNSEVTLIGFSTYNQHAACVFAGTDAVWSITKLIGCSFGATDAAAVTVSDGDLIVIGSKFISANVGIANGGDSTNKITVSGNSFNGVVNAYYDSTTDDVETEWKIGEDNHYTDVANYGFQLTLQVFIDTDATPNVSNHKKWRTGNTGGAVDLTDFDGLLYDGKELIILGADGGNSTVKHDITKINMVGGADFAIGDGDVLHLIYDGDTGDWNEVSRANNTIA